MLSQRKFFRIDTVMPCSYRILRTEEEKNQNIFSTSDEGYIEQYFMADMAELDSTIDKMVKAGQEQCPQLAKAVLSINKKINFLLNTLDESQLNHAIPMRSMNISGNGAALEIKEPIALEDEVELLLKPLEHEGPILVRCDVVKILEMPESDHHWVALNYKNLSIEDSRKLIFHIQSKEIEQAQTNRAD